MPQGHIPLGDARELLGVSPDIFSRVLDSGVVLAKDDFVSRPSLEAHIQSMRGHDYFARLVPEIAGSRGVTENSEGFAYSRIVGLYKQGLVSYVGNSGKAFPIYSLGQKKAILKHFASELPCLREEAVDDIKNIRVLGADDEQVALARVRVGDKSAFDFMVVHNLRLVNNEAASIYNFVVRSDPSIQKSLDFEDTVQDGFFGLHNALTHYRAERAYEMGFMEPFKFSTPAVNWIRQAITRRIQNMRSTVRLPVHRGTDYSRIIKARQVLLGRGIDPTIEGILAHTGIEYPRYVAIMNTRNTASLDADLTGPDDIRLADVIPDKENDPFAEALRSHASAAIDAELSHLSSREQNVIRASFGLDGNPRTLEEIGREIGLSRAMVRVIKNQALLKLRESRILQDL